MFLKDKKTAVVLRKIIVAFTEKLKIVHPSGRFWRQLISGKATILFPKRFGQNKNKRKRKKVLLAKTLREVSGTKHLDHAYVALLD